MYKICDRPNQSRLVNFQLAVWAIASFYLSVRVTPDFLYEIAIFVMKINNLM
ncbi:MAG: hypothetical protein JGK17_23270 [Microcoleus sp. PH2017_10_PVI_O_A]|uniref:hypothetical protein n=1 Tax=unclassified Microcoleus TaxID=2642155 RepID=UPI001D55EA44|nr:MULTISPECIES: hypothetical protein [unclassified Microcoleus]MCC3408451.1 hypothetical protein [Microcoleus sp. PH2017_10_PVI_O_A]MCC3462548.1 hypothetical protein [Microcoleus sp. PH2017_11_PCY_U_A]MCC3480958.1 hypothetical protein [Microcoleus sp. PH2017_12_PCY_D_A]MCC3530406.1 hypothetical protein [Microcoleus sp. PH2017_21_RUC_O_A]MCC3542716.1 hypothetical protein [Microcoleus sp. PH2017_22_RUC_O_B]